MSPGSELRDPDGARKWVTPSLDELLKIDQDSVNVASSAVLQALADGRDAARLALAEDVSNAVRTWVLREGDLAASYSALDVAKAVTFLSTSGRPNVGTAGLGPEQLGELLGIDAEALGQHLVDSGLASAILPPHVRDGVNQRAKLTGLDPGALMLELLLGSPVPVLKDPPVPPPTLGPPWPVVGRSGRATADPDGSLGVSSDLAELGAWEDSASCGAVIRVPSSVTSIRVDTSVRAEWFVSAFAMYGYAGAGVNIGVGVWDGNNQLALSEREVASAYAPVLWLAMVDGSGDVVLSVEHDLPASGIDRDLVVAVKMRSNVGGAAVGAFGSARATARVDALGVRFGA